jgi:DUF1365 family protein
VTATALYEGWVRHRRFEPVRPELRVGLFMTYVDLAELPEVFDSSRLWSARRPALAWFRRADYLGDPRQPLRDAALDAVQERTGVRPDGPVRVLTHLRTLGYLFNPVTFYYCFDAAGERVEAVAAEVTNTPWGERHVYALAREDGGEGRVLSGRVGKRFHVSPFLGMDAEYDWRLTDPGDDLQVHVESCRGDRVDFDATLSLRRREPTPAALRRALVRHPLMPLRVVGGIYAHAVRLKLKGAPYHPHPAHERPPHDRRSSPRAPRPSGTPGDRRRLVARGVRARRGEPAGHRHRP